LRRPSIDASAVKWFALPASLWPYRPAKAPAALLVGRTQTILAIVVVGIDTTTTEP
jgi:hypothetical protein